MVCIPPCLGSIPRPSLFLLFSFSLQVTHELFFSVAENRNLVHLGTSEHTVQLDQTLSNWDGETKSKKDGVCSLQSAVGKSTSTRVCGKQKELKQKQFRSS